MNWPYIWNEWWRMKSEHSLWVTVKQGLSCHTMGTCALHVMWRRAGARSMRRLMAIHPGASGASHSPPCLTALSRQEEREEPLRTHPGWEHFMIITIIFPQKIIHRGLCQNWIALPLEHMVQILCGECGESGCMHFWSCSTGRQRLPAFSPSLPVHFFISLPQSSLAFLYSVFPSCATNHLYGFPWHLLFISPMNRLSKVHKWSLATYPFMLENHTALPIYKLVLMRSRSSESSSSYSLCLHQIRKLSHNLKVLYWKLRVRGTTWCPCHYLDNNSIEVICVLLYLFCGDYS